MSKRRHIRGKVYFTNDKILVGGKGKKRRVVSMGKDKENMEVRRILSLYDKGGKKKENLIPIEKYLDIPKPSGVEYKTFRQTINGKPIKENQLGKTKTRLNKWDMERISRSNKKPKKIKGNENATLGVDGLKNVRSEIPDATQEKLYNSTIKKSNKNKQEKKKMKKQTSQKRASTTAQSGTTYTVKQGKTQMTFSTKTEARAAASELKGATITEGRKKATHHRVSFTAKK